MFELLEDHLDRAMAYYGEDLSPAEHAVFEAHLVGCADCQKLIADARALLPAAEQALASAPRRTLAEAGAHFEALLAERRAATPLPFSQRRTVRLVGYALAASLLVAVGFVAFRALGPKPPAPQQLAAPRAP